MTITVRQARELKKRIKKLVQAELIHAYWEEKGSQPIYNTAEELRIAKKRMTEYIEMLRLPDGRMRP